MSSKHRLACVGLMVAACVAAPISIAQAPIPTSPSRSSRRCSPAAASTSSRARSPTARRKALGQPIVVENQSGGGGIVGSQATARAAPDGYTLMVGYVGTHGTNPAVRKLPYDAIKDFTPIAMVGGTPNVLVVAAVGAGEDARRVHRVREGEPGQARVRLGRARARSRTWRWSSSRSRPDLDMVHVAYRGIGPAITDILGGQTQAMFPGLAAALPHIKAGKMRPLAVTGLKRHPLLPDVPTFEELGYKGFDGVQWYGIVGPANMPAADRHARSTPRSTRCSPTPTCASGFAAKRSSRCR